MSENGWKRLADAIILQAVQDYRALGRGPILEDPEGRYVSDEELEWFFYSDWFKRLTTLDGKYIFRKLKKERENGSIPRTGYIVTRRNDC